MLMLVLKHEPFQFWAKQKEVLLSQKTLYDDLRNLLSKAVVVTRTSSRRTRALGSLQKVMFGFTSA